jgi:hypothetical protein
MAKPVELQKEIRDNSMDKKICFPCPHWSLRYVVLDDIRIVHSSMAV